MFLNNINRDDKLRCQLYLTVYSTPLVFQNKSDVVCNFYQSAEDVPDPRELSSEKKNLIVFDDLLLKKQNTSESYYVRGRHSNVDCFYLAQNYFKLPSQTIREYAKFICVSPRPEEP